MVTFEKAQTTITANAITIEGLTFTVTASAEQIPSTCTVMGLLSLSGSNSSRLFFGENNGSLGSLTFSGTMIVSFSIVAILVSVSYDLTFLK